MYVAGIIAVLVILYVISVYNKLVGLKNGIENSFNQIKVAMKKRFDMIGQLVDTTKSYLKFEKGLFTDVAKLRNMNLNNAGDLEKGDALAKSVMGNFFAVAENYPKSKGAET